MGKSSLREEMSERLNKTEHEKKGSEEVEEVVSAGFQRPSGVAVSENKSTEILSDKGVSSTHASEKTVVVKKEQQFKLNVNAKPFRFNAAAASFTPKAAAAPATSSTSIPSGNGGVPVPAAVPGQLGPAYGGGQYLSGPGGVASGMYMGPPGALIQPRGPRGPVGYERPQPIGHQPRGPQSIGYEHGGHLPHGVQG